MKLIVAVYDDWGIGARGTQPVALSADRKFFRAVTRGHAVIVGRRTMLDFPGCQPLPGRDNYLLTRSEEVFPGFLPVHSPEEAAEKAGDDAFVIGGGSVYKMMLPLCDEAFVTKVHTLVDADTFFPNLDESPEWELCEVLQSGEESGIAYEMCRYTKKTDTIA